MFILYFTQGHIRHVHSCLDVTCNLRFRQKHGVRYVHFPLAMSNRTVELLGHSRRLCCSARQLVKCLTGIITKRLNTEHDTYSIQTPATCLGQSQNDSTQNTTRIVYRHHQPVLGLVVCVERTDFGQQNPHYV